MKRIPPPSPSVRWSMRRNTVTGMWVLTCRDKATDQVVVPAAAFESPAEAFAEIKRWRERVAA